ncbi:hypothetical protein ABMA79_09095 [Halobacteriovorax sp. HFRX-2_2]|uniref:hypothetical protein n=1 Tax=unclassified Halobacteriovorax TaxID=2639665 RepID=UPI0037110100
MKKLILLVCLFTLTKSVFAAVSKDEYEQVKDALYQAYSELAPSQNEVLQINLPIAGLPDSYWWDIDMIHASYVQATNQEDQIEHRIYLMGGFGRLAGMTPDGLALTACHEIGHGIGGDPKKDDPMNMGYHSSMEGQSDFFATKDCLAVVFKYLPELREVKEKPIYKDLCSKQDKHEYFTCLRLLTAMEADQAFFKSNGDEVSFETYSSNVATELNTDPSYYPAAQCRFDTMINGILDLERPECWYPGGEKNGTLR